MSIQLGDRVRDQVTGFEGIVVGITTWLHGCRRCVVQPRELRDGKPIEAQTFDEPQLEAIDRAVVGTTHKTGGPSPNAERRGTPIR